MAEDSSATTELTKEAFEEKESLKLSDEEWQKYRYSLQGARKGDAVWDLVVENMQLRAKVDSLKGEVEEKQVLVMGVSAVADDESLREMFRKKQVGERPCRGGFIAQEFYLNFVKAAREVEARDGENYGPNEDEKQKVVAAVADLGAILSTAGRPEYSMLNDGFLDEEGPQSAVAAELFQCAIDAFQENDTLDKHRLRVTHQQQLLTDIHKINRDGDSQQFEILRCPPKKRDSSGKTKETGENKGVRDKKSDDRIDVCVWFVHKDESLGACVLAAAEYKPSSTKEVARKAQADMYGSNITLLHKKPCVVIDIAGGTDLKHWKVSACGLVEAEFTKDNFGWEKTPLYEGSGAEAIVMVAYGLMKAKTSFPGRLDDFGERLGPVVGVIGDEHVFKVYDDAKIRKPNLDVIQKLLDKDATILSSKDGKLIIIKMKKFESNWKEPVCSKVFFTIIEKLKTLHDQFGPHGDIRLANLLSTGHIIDFDFVGAESYPCTLQSIPQDGARHEEVENWISAQGDGKVASLSPRKEHDWFSLGRAMKLFDSVNEKNQSNWSGLCTAIELGDCDRVCIEDYQIQLRDKTIPLQGTGHTPVRKPLTKPSAQTAKRTKRNESASIPESA